MAETYELKWNQLDLDHGIFQVVRKKPVSAVIITFVAVSGVRCASSGAKGPHAGEFVFASGRGGPLKPRAVQVMFDRISRAAGMEELNLRPHVLRHSCGYALSDRGANLREIQDYLGHREVPHTTRYVALSPHRFDGLWDD